jgi:hypothetical protein
MRKPDSTIRGIPGAFRILSEKWVASPIKGCPKLPQTLSTDMREVTKLDTGNNWAKNGMKGWHAGSNAAIASRLGLLLSPIQWLGGYIMNCLPIGSPLSPIHLVEKSPPIGE